MRILLVGKEIPGNRVGLENKIRIPPWACIFKQKNSLKTEKVAQIFDDDDAFSYSLSFLKLFKELSTLQTLLFSRRGRPN